jgi:Tol biopolymer transport system component
MRGRAYIRLSRLRALWSLIAVFTALLIAATASAVSPASVGDWPKTQLVSRASGSEGPGGNLPSFEPTATADGRFVFFTSYATNFTPSLPARGLRLFRRDMRSHRTTLVPTVGHEPERPVVSANGRFLAYVSSIDYSDGGGHKETFVRDLHTGSTRLASRTNGAGGAPASVPPTHEFHPSVDRPSLSANGRYLAFVSTAPNLFPAAYRGRVPPQIYVRDLVADTTTLVSRASGRRGQIADAPCAEPEISADGRHIAFTSSATNLGATGPRGDVFDGNVFVRDLASAKTTVVSRTRVATTSYAPAISANGRYVAFYRKGLHVPIQVFERDLRSGHTVLVSRASGANGAPANDSISRSFLGISPDGTLVAFFSNATNLGGPPSPVGSGLYLRDLKAKETTFVHWEVPGWAKPHIVGGGRYLIFGTFNTDQPTPNGAYASGDVYRYDRGPASE